MSGIIRDPVCGMPIEADRAVASERLGEVTYYFCDARCHRLFQRDPEQYTRDSAHEPGRTDTPRAR